MEVGRKITRVVKALMGHRLPGGGGHHPGINLLLPKNLQDLSLGIILQAG
jgi:hypothetical protein